MNHFASTVGTRHGSFSFPASVRYGPSLLAWAALLAVLALGLPLFLCMPLTVDSVHYDLCARTLIRGGTLYRDVFDNNLPGVIWIHAGIRTVLGWRSEALRLADFGFVTITIGLLLRWVPCSTGRWCPARVGTAAALFLLYLFSFELGHCQRDIWMLLPATVAVSLRDRQVRGIAARESDRKAFGRACLEGAFWGAAFWIKPFVAVPALACWVASLLSSRCGRPTLLLDAAGVLAGGLLAGCLGLAWLAGSGSWQAFWTIFLEWNRDYASHGLGEYPRGRMLLYWMVVYFPWSLAHLVAIPTSLIMIVGVARRHGEVDPALASRSILGSFYLGWLMQAVVIQRPQYYVLISTFFPAVTLAACALVLEMRQPVRHAVLLIFLFFTISIMPGLRPGRLALWPRCVREGSTPELRDGLALTTWVDWRDLSRVADFLRREGVADRELACLSGCTHALYLDLHLEPSTRFPQVGSATIHFPLHTEQIKAELRESPTRYVVSDSAWEVPESDYKSRDSVGRKRIIISGLPEDVIGEFLCKEPVVYRAGRYEVRRYGSLLDHPNHALPPKHQ